MPCSRHHHIRSRKSSFAESSYSRDADWWKDSAHISNETDDEAGYSKASGYEIIRKRKTNWSLLVLSGLKGMTVTEAKFHYYASKWKEEIGGDSSLTSATSNMNYLRIIRIGEDAIPLILKDLQKHPAPWFIALRAISEDDSIGRGSPGDFRKKAAEWIQWGKERGYIK